MATPRRIARRWTPEQIERFATEPDFPKADAYARRVSPLVAALWNAERDDAADEREAASQAEAIAAQVRPQR